MSLKNCPVQNANVSKALVYEQIITHVVTEHINLFILFEKQFKIFLSDFCFAIHILRPSNSTSEN